MYEEKRLGDCLVLSLVENMIRMRHGTPGRAASSRRRLSEEETFDALADQIRECVLDSRDRNIVK